MSMVADYIYMALPTPTPPQGSSHYTTNTVFSSVYICQKPASVAYPDKKTVTG